MQGEECGEQREQEADVCVESGVSYLAEEPGFPAALRRFCDVLSVVRQAGVKKAE